MSLFNINTALSQLNTHRGEGRSCAAETTGTGSTSRSILSPMKHTRILRVPSRQEEKEIYQVLGAWLVCCIGAGDGDHLCGTQCWQLGKASEGFGSMGGLEMAPQALKWTCRFSQPCLVNYEKKMVV